MYWLSKTLRIERGVVKQIVDDVKSDASRKTMNVADELLELLRLSRQETQFAGEQDWLFPSIAKLGRQPLSYTFVWETLDAASGRAGIGHVSSHIFRHTHRAWLDSLGTPVGVQQRLMRHSDIRTTMNVYGDSLPEDERAAHEKLVKLALTDRKLIAKRSN
jgi:integrase